MTANKSNKKVTIHILSSVIGYGVYFPALVLYKQLKQLDFNVHIHIIERFFNEKATTQFQKTKEAFQKNVRLVKIASQLSVSYTNKFDEDRISALFKTWKGTNSTHFLCFSGLWLEILNRYKSNEPAIIIDSCRVDTEVSATWEALDRYKDLIRLDFSFFNAAKQTVNYILTIPSIKPKPFDKRISQVTIHGGGWDLGNFKDIVGEIEQSNFEINLVLNDSNQLIVQDTQKKRTIYANKPLWDPLVEDGFPPFGYLKNKQLELTNYQEYPGVLSIIIQSNAIISKPGGMTLMDSLLTETPLVFLKAIGKNEKGNKKLWETLQLGIDFDDWKDTNFSLTILEEMYTKIVHLKKEIPCLLSTYIKQLHKP